MRILILGDTGLLGSHIARALAADGHAVTGAARELDFTVLATAAAWAPHLAGMEAVVNCVGVFRAREPDDFERVHHTAPAALFEACERMGIRRVIHVSALGSGARAATAYWRSKGAGEDALRGHDLDYTIVRPSLVYGADGASSRLFLALATMPAVALPEARGALVQPVHVDDLAAAVAALLRPEHGGIRELAAVGPRALAIGEYLADLRRGMRAGGALTLKLPMALAGLAARLAALHPASPLTPDALAMLAAGGAGANTAAPAGMAVLLGRSPRDPATFAGPADKPRAVLAWSVPLARMTLAALWLWTAWVSWFAWPHGDSMAWLAACGIPATLQSPALLGASVLDAAIGCALLPRPRRWLWPLQLCLVGGYTAAMTLCLPEFWLHPFGPLSKNIPLLALMLVLWRLHDERN